jgi:hypothetical protein
MTPLTGSNSISQAVALLAEALGRHESRSSPHYDEVFDQVSAQASIAGELGKLEVAALVVWKRLNASTRWASALMSTDDDDVRRTTAAMIAAARTPSDPADRASKARRELLTLAGCRTGDALASALICAANPRDMAVYDRRADHALKVLGLGVSPKPGRYGRYIQTVTSLRDAAAQTGITWTARQVDLALYAFGA